MDQIRKSLPLRDFNPLWKHFRINLQPFHDFQPRLEQGLTRCHRGSLAYRRNQGDVVMLNKLAVVALITVASPALAQAMPQTQDDWYVNSGRYINGQVPSYTQAPSHNLYLAVGETRRQGRLIEGRYSAAGPQEYFFSGRDGMVNATGN
jgi:hypothetical protein